MADSHDGNPPNTGASPARRDVQAFLCYRRADGAFHAEWLNQLLNGTQYTELDGSHLGQKLETRFEQLNRTMILEALEKSKGKKSKAADMLNINRRTLYNRMRKLGLS